MPEEAVGPLRVSRTFLHPRAALAHDVLDPYFPAFAADCEGLFFIYRPRLCPVVLGATDSNGFVSSVR